MVAGLIVLVGFLSVGPVSRRFSIWTAEFVGSVLSRAEVAAQYLVIAHAYRIVARNGIDVDRRQISESLCRTFVTDDAGASVSACLRRLRALRVVLMDLPRSARRLLRRIEKQNCGAMGVGPFSSCFDTRLWASLCDWRLVENRVERPPDDGRAASPSLLPPSGFRTGDAVGFAAAYEGFASLAGVPERRSTSRF